jgi:predicted DNA-binding protein with PD1-like motif
MSASPLHALCVIACRLHPGDDLRGELERLTRERALAAACVLSAVGSLKRAAIRYASEPFVSVLDGSFEIVSLTGTLSPDGPHVHIAIADENGIVIGGHLGPGSLVRTTVELVIGVLEGAQFSRALDAQTGYRELQIGSARSR